MNCPKCNQAMRLLPSKYGNGKYWGCTGFPKCRTTMPMGKNDKAMLKRTEKVEIVPGSVPRPTYKPTCEQQAILDAVVRERLPIVECSAGAGCAKTSTMVLAAYEIGDQLPNVSVAAIAFNNSIVDELIARMPAFVTVKSAHQYGLMIWKALWGNVEIDKLKVQRLVNAEVPMIFREGGRLTREEKVENAVARLKRSAVRQLVSWLKNMMHEEGDHDWAVLDELVKEHGLEIEGFRGEIYSLTFTVYDRSMQERNVVDFDDMLLFPAMIIKICVESNRTLPIPRFDVVITDETQDLNKPQHWLMLGAIGGVSGKYGQFMYVGDRRQAIYGFRGADYYSMDNLGELIASHTGNSITRRTLSITQRCAKRIVEMANQIEPSLRARDDAPEGKVEVWNTFDPLQLADNPGMYMVTSRCNAPLAETALQLIRARIPVHIAGSKFGDDILEMVVQSRARTPRELVEWCDIKMAKMLENTLETPAQILQYDQYETLASFAGEVESLDDLKEMVEKLFSDKPSTSAVLLSSIHRAKGLERHTVICIPVHAPHPMAKGDLAREQEINLLYVQWTRAKERLIIVLDPKVAYAYPILTN